jgi:hypothetical protein
MRKISREIANKSRDHLFPLTKRSSTVDLVWAEQINAAVPQKERSLPRHCLQRRVRHHHAGATTQTYTHPRHTTHRGRSSPLQRLPPSNPSRVTLTVHPSSRASRRGRKEKKKTEEPRSSRAHARTQSEPRPPTRPDRGLGFDGMSGDGEGAGSGGGGESPPAAAAAGATLHIRCANGSKFTVQADLGATVGSFKAVVAGSCAVPAPQQRLIYKGRILKDEQTLESYGACHADS